MGIRRLQGWALILSAVISLLSLVGSNSSLFRVLFFIGALLLIFGVPAIQTEQHAGILGWIGIILIEIGAVIALILNAASLNGSAYSAMALPVASALAGGIGRLIVGWLTARRRIFAAWVGWAFLLEGLLNIFDGLVEAEYVTPVLGAVIPLLGAAALLGYGWGIIRRKGS
jgi:hypothetical protein